MSFTTIIGLNVFYSFFHSGNRGFRTKKKTCWLRKFPFSKISTHTCTRPVQLLWPWQLSEIIASSQHCTAVRLGFKPLYISGLHTHTRMREYTPLSECLYLAVSHLNTHMEPELIPLFVALEPKLVAPATNLTAFSKKKRRTKNPFCHEEVA